jgi:predicted XRE-type DNA-binding protein
LAGSAVDLKRKILSKIEAEMEKVGMSQAEMGRILDVKRTDINMYLRGTNTSVSFERLIEMADTVGLDIDVVVKKRKG